MLCKIWISFVFLILLKLSRKHSFEQNSAVTFFIFLTLSSSISFFTKVSISSCDSTIIYDFLTEEKWQRSQMFMFLLCKNRNENLICKEKQYWYWILHVSTTITSADKVFFVVNSSISYYSEKERKWWSWKQVDLWKVIDWKG